MKHEPLEDGEQTRRPDDLERAPSQEDAAPPAPGEDPGDVAVLRGEVAAAKAREAAAIERFRTALLVTEPTMDPALVTGETMEAVHASFIAARASLARVREALRMEAAARIPAGAPGRMVPQPRTPLQKIRDGLARD